MAASTQTYNPSLEPPVSFVTLTPSDTIPVGGGWQWLKIGVAGNLSLKGLNDTAACTAFPVAAGEYVPFGGGYIMVTGTSATGFTGMR